MVELPCIRAGDCTIAWFHGSTKIDLHGKRALHLPPGIPVPVPEMGGRPAVIALPAEHEHQRQQAQQLVN